LGLSSAALLIYIANRQRRSHKLGRVERAIDVCDEMLKHAKANRARSHVDLMNGTRRLLE
jgi:hypothetical protein